MNSPEPPHSRTDTRDSVPSFELSTNNPWHSLSGLARLGARALQAPVCAISLEEETGIRIIALHEDDSHAGQFAAPDLEALCRIAFDREEPLFVESADSQKLSAHQDQAHVAGTDKSWISVPVSLADARVRAIVLIVDTRSRFWTGEDVEAASDVAAEVASRINASESESGTNVHQQLRESQRRNTAILESTIDSIIVLGTDLRVLDMNSSAAKRFGHTLDELLGQLAFEVLFPAETCQLLADLVRRPPGDDDVEVLCRNLESAAIDSSGQRFPVEVTLTRSTTGQDSGKFLIVRLRDVTSSINALQDIRFFKEIVDAVGQSVVAADMDGRITYLNRAAEEALGWNAEQAIGQNVRELIPAAAYRRRSNQLGTIVREEGSVLSEEFQLRRRDGSIMPALVTLAPLKSDDNSVVGTIGIYTDITALKESQRETRFFHDAMESVGQAVVLSDWNRRITYWNPAAERMMGWECREVIGKNLLDIVPDRQQRERAVEIAEFVRRGYPFSGEFALRRRDGSVFSALINLAPVYDGTGEFVGVASVYTDISEQKEIERDLRVYKHIVDAVGQAVIANDLDRGITYWNPAAEELLGWKAEEVLGKDSNEIAPAREFLHNIPAVGKHVREGKTWTSEFLLRHRDGTSIQTLSTIKPILDEDGQVVGVLGAHADIRELKNVEKDLRFHKLIVDSVGQAVVANQLDEQRSISYWNAAAEQMLGWSAAEAIGRPFFELVPASESLAEIEELNKTVRQGHTWRGEYWLKHREGHTIPVLASVTPVLDDDGNLVGVIGAYADISELKATEDELRFHKHIVDAVGQAVVVSDTDGTITYWNRAAESIYGWKAGEVLGRSVVDVVPSELARAESAEVTALVAAGNTWSGETLVQARDGKEFPGFFTVSPITDQSGDIIGIIGVSHDISERKQYEREIELNKLMLDSVAQAVIATDQHLKITFWNRGAQEFFGWSAEEMIGTPFLNTMPPGSPGLFKTVDAIEVVSRLGEWKGEIVAQNREGAEIAALVTSSAIVNEQDEQIGLISAFADITERKVAEAELKESNRRIVEILESMGEGFLSLERDWTITYVNHEAERVLEYHREEILGKRLWDVFADAKQQGVFAHYADVLQNGEPVRFTEYYSGLDKWFEIHAFPSGDRFSLFFRDVTERLQAEDSLRRAEKRFRTLVEQLPAMTYIATPDDLSKVTYTSPQVETIFGYTVEEWMSSPDFWFDLVHPDDREHVLQEDAESVAKRDGFSIEYRQRTKDGRYVWLRDSARLIYDEDGDPLYWQGISFDVTAEKDVERALRESEQRFRSLFDNNPDAVFSIDHTGRVLSANPAFTRVTGQDPLTEESLTFTDLVVEEDRERAKDHFSQTHMGDPQDFYAGIVDHRGDRLELSITTIPIIVDDHIAGVHVVAQDVTLHQELESQLAHQAYHDSLTGLPNRNLFQNRLALRLTEARRNHDRFAVLFFDLDEFKIVNDSLGHSIGDQLLIKVAERVKHCIRGDDLLARLGGDEFTLLMNVVRNERETKLLADRIAGVLDDPFDLEGHEVFATTSIGIALGDENSTHADDILRNADMAMYEAKNSGKNRFAVFDPGMNSRAWKRLTLESEIRRGLINDEFRIFYQPIVDLHTGDLEKIEALVRWQHPQRGLLSPGDFISVAEQSSLILPLGRWIMEHATRQVADWAQSNPEDRSISLSLNLSARQYQHPRLIEELTQFLEDQHVDPGLITLEITESVAMDQSSTTIQTLLRLKDLGVQLALDDFGTGFSAMSYLRRFPIDIIKIDRSFVDGLGVDPEDTSIIEAIMAAALTMNLHVTAEGIETREQLNMLRDLGCKTGQGYFISKPLSATEIGEILTTCKLPWLDRIAASEE